MWKRGGVMGISYLWRIINMTEEENFLQSEQSATEIISTVSGAFPSARQFWDSAGQGAGLSCLGCAFAKKICTTWYLKSSFNLVYYDSMIYHAWGPVLAWLFLKTLAWQSNCPSGSKIKLCDYYLFYEYCKLCFLCGRKSLVTSQCI